VDEALVAFDRALAIEPAARVALVLDDADRLRVRLLLGRARACVHLGRWDEADTEIRGAHRLALDLGEGRLLGQTWFEMGQMHRRHTDLAAAEAAYGEALRLADQESDASLRVRALNRSAGVLWARGDLEQARRAWIEVLALGDTTRDRHSVAVGYAGLGLMAICRGQSAEARRHLEQACVEFEALGALDQLTVTRVDLVELYHLTGNLRRGLLLADKTLAQAREIRYQEGMALGLRYRALILVSLGHLAEASAHVEEALAILRAQGNTEEELGCLHAMVRIAVYRQDAAEAARWLAAVEALLDRYDVEGIAPVVHAWRALLEAWRGDREAVLAAVALSDSVEGRRWPMHLCRVDVIVARALSAVGERDAAEARARAALERSEAAGYLFYTMKAHALLGGFVRDATAAGHHQRVSEALARSLAANSAPEDASSFLSIHGFESST
jgi:tetratricopeptide (TPR) repeat protein